MNVLIVIAHPNPASFNYALLESVERGLRSAGHIMRIRDLSREPMDPVLGPQELEDLQQGQVATAVTAEQEGLRWAEGLVFIYPLWWFDRPAILKGWCDRVLTHGFAFRYDEHGVQGLLPQQKAMVIVTAGGTEQEFKDMKVSSEQLLLPMTCGTLKFCGVDKVESYLFYDVGGVSAEERTEMLVHTEALGASF